MLISTPFKTGKNFLEIAHILRQVMNNFSRETPDPNFNATFIRKIIVT